MTLKSNLHNNLEHGTKFKLEFYETDNAFKTEMLLFHHQFHLPTLIFFLKKKKRQLLTLFLMDAQFVVDNITLALISISIFQKIFLSLAGHM